MATLLPKSNQAIAQIISYLDRGEVVVIHTDVVYLLLANALNSQATNRIHELKGWNPRKPLTLLLTPAKVPEYSNLGTDAQTLVNQFPYPISLILPHRNNLPEAVTAGHREVFVSCPDQFIYDLAAQAPFPIAAGTASLGSEMRANDAKTAAAFFGDHVPLIIDGGKSKERIRTTLIDCHLPLPTILNFGLISFDELRAIIPHIELPSHLRK
ncbi:L-threonylcarbamoyladenylate synthase [Synechococcus moorigangaii CMS01]|nr:L-threonylcarbamoyladenylate synthase [Synechococcus moorigangaii CMS01]